MLKQTQRAFKRKVTAVRKRIRGLKTFSPEQMNHLWPSIERKVNQTIKGWGKGFAKGTEPTVSLEDETRRFERKTKEITRLRDRELYKELFIVSARFSLNGIGIKDSKKRKQIQELIQRIADKNWTDLEMEIKSNREFQKRMQRETFKILGLTKGFIFWTVFDKKMEQWSNASVQANKDEE